LFGSLCVIYIFSIGKKEMILAFQTEAEFSEAEKIASEIQKVLNKVDAENVYYAKATEQ